VVLTTCTGAMWLASTGLVDGKKCTTNRGFLSVAKASHPNVDWQDQRWVVDEKPYEGSEGKGELWTSGAAGAGEFPPSEPYVLQIEILLSSFYPWQGSR
jgi:transcriptional regulator GlxA family with amidase domain